MKMFLSLLVVLVAACSDGQAAFAPSHDRNVQQFGSTAQPKVDLAGRVTDAADILNQRQKAALSRQLEELERSTGHQMVIVTVSALDGQDVAAFTRELANAWGVGRAEQKDGVVFLIAPNERKVRIAVGTGLERTLPDHLCKKIIDDEILPRFKMGDLPGGIDAGAAALMRELKQPRVISK